ncbi:MAG: hypothetical protein ABA06_00330 [Parcubacteria bacterium C7867-001]|nr:MAG: hypothetical protein ABA06_00330 [Parcubacteria bacterium C7867-001]
MAKKQLTLSRTKKVDFLKEVFEQTCRRYPQPWTVRPSGWGFIVVSQDDIELAHFWDEDDAREFVAFVKQYLRERKLWRRESEKAQHRDFRKGREGVFDAFLAREFPDILADV